MAALYLSCACFVFVCSSSFFSFFFSFFPLVKLYRNTKGEFWKKMNGVVLYYFPNTLDSGLAQFSNRCRSCPIEISLDIDCDVNVLTKKN